MILISSSSTDTSTNNVIDWILFYNYNIKLLRINDDINYEIKFDGNKIFITDNNNKEYDIKLFNSFWYRRGRIRYKSKNYIQCNSEISENEEKVLEEYIHYELKKNRHINDFYNSEPNKLIILEEARKNNLLIPETFICQNKNDVLKIHNCRDLITKTLLGPSMIFFEDKASIIYTSIINKKRLPQEFVPSLIQYRIHKKYELRIFYFNNRFWTMAILSQNDIKTSVDYKQYNRKKPNRTVPYKLPISVVEKLKELIKNLKYESCSIDMIVTLANEFVFLEINPIGQFGMVSIPCNYHFEREIAKFLIYES